MDDDLFGRGFKSFISNFCFPKFFLSHSTMMRVFDKLSKTFLLLFVFIKKKHFAEIKKKS